MPGPPPPPRGNARTSYSRRSDAALRLVRAREQRCLRCRLGCCPLPPSSRAFVGAPAVDAERAPRAARPRARDRAKRCCELTVRVHGDDITLVVDIRQARACRRARKRVPRRALAAPRTRSPRRRAGVGPSKNTSADDGATRPVSIETVCLPFTEGPPFRTTLTSRATACTTTRLNCSHCEVHGQNHGGARAALTGRWSLDMRPARRSQIVPTSSQDGSCGAETFTPSFASL